MLSQVSLNENDVYAKSYIATDVKAILLLQYYLFSENSITIHSTYEHQQYWT